MSEPEHFDVVVVGAGLSGIAAGYHLRSKCPGRSFVILEGRASMGGTWDLFRYPGVRSDSDMYTLGYSFRPWKGDKSLADGPSILQYIKDTAHEYDLERRIRYGHRVERASYSSATKRWTVEVRRDDGSIARFACRFLFLCSGYYDYAEGYSPELPGRERYRGRVVHPQHWTPDIDYAGKHVVVIGSGATAVTLVPELAKKAAHVVMLQRSPTYILSIPGHDPASRWLEEHLPGRAAFEATRWKNVAFLTALYGVSRRFPAFTKRHLIDEVKKSVGPGVDVATHFTPRYDPWDQRLCFVPDGDLFEAVKAGRAELVTDHIDGFNETGLSLRSGKRLDADLVITATGLKLLLFGGIALEVDGRPVEASRTLCYKGAMLSDVPNFAMALGYTNASWTLKCDLICAFVCRLLNELARRGADECVPRVNDPTMGTEPIIDFQSGYVLRMLDQLPKQGTKPPWKLYQNYGLDLVSFRYGKLDDGALHIS